MAGNSGGRYEMIDGKRVRVEEPVKPFVKPKKETKPKTQEVVDE